MNRPALASLVLALAAATAGCKRSPPVVAGFGGWDVPRGRLGQVMGGRCDPTDLPDGRHGAWCLGIRGTRLGDQGAQVEAYFAPVSPPLDPRALDPSWPLIELQLSVRACEVGELDRTLRDLLGTPVESGAGRAFWENSQILVAALLPSSTGSCFIRVFPRSELAEYQRVRAAPQP